MATTTYIGLVYDRINNNKIVYQSRPCADYYTAHARAEKHAKGDRYTVDVAQSDKHNYANDAIRNK